MKFMGLENMKIRLFPGIRIYWIFRMHLFNMYFSKDIYNYQSSVRLNNYSFHIFATKHLTACFMVKC